MNELGATTDPLFSYGVLAVTIIVAFIAWFFVNRASVRASEQIQLLSQLLEEQKKQNALLRRLLESQRVEQEKPETEEPREFIRMIPER